MLNLVQSDRIEGGWQIGKVENLVGDSSSGKTFVALSTQAACCLEDRFDKFNFNIIIPPIINMIHDYEWEVNHKNRFRI